MDLYASEMRWLTRFGLGVSVMAGIGLVCVAAFGRPDETVSASLRAEKMRLATAPVLVKLPKAIVYLELSDGAIPAYIKDFDQLQPPEVRARLESLSAGTVVTVQRPVPPSLWDGPFAIYGVRIGDDEILSRDMVVAMKRAYWRRVALLLGCLGVLGLVLAATGRLWLLRSAGQDPA